ncbi:hypothetical protein N0V90_002194 [Kalmusia sp. IMI 367209]|nr:hypothetical protein N0V90_002194 [Kalmusia sp. IMI 367209]
MSSNEKGNFPPSYTESIQQPYSPIRTGSSTDRGQNILDRLTLTRAHNIRSEKNEFSFDTFSTPQVQVIGFSSDEEPKVVGLEGQVNKTEFWRVQAVLEELERTLQGTLNRGERLRGRRVLW